LTNKLSRKPREGEIAAGKRLSTFSIIERVIFRAKKWAVFEQKCPFLGQKTAKTG
jgi:hypothetical protein